MSEISILNHNTDMNLMEHLILDTPTEDFLNSTYLNEKLIHDVAFEYEICENPSDNNNNNNNETDDFIKSVIFEFDSNLIDQNQFTFSIEPFSSFDSFLGSESDFDLHNLLEFNQEIPLQDNITVGMPKKALNNLYHFPRNQPIPISIYYNVVGNNKHLKVDLISGSPAAEETIKFCKLSEKTKHSKYWFLCNNNSIEIGNCFQTDLDPLRNERTMSIKFACNTSCESMYNKSILKFSIIDANNTEVCHQSFNIRVSERPSRDEKDLIKKLEKEEIRKFNYPEDLPAYAKEFQIIKNEVPKLKNYTAPICKFEISLANDNKKFSENNFSESIEKLVTFNITEASIENSDSELYVRAMIIDPKHPENRIVCLKGHGNLGDLKSHILRSNHPEAMYQGSENGFYPDERISVRTPCQSSLSYSFMCKNFCWLERDRFFAGLIFILEDKNGQMFARRYFKFAIVDRPNRSTLNYDSDDCKTAATKRKSTGETPDKKRPNTNQ